MSSVYASLSLSLVVCLLMGALALGPSDPPTDDQLADLAYLEGLLPPAPARDGVDLVALCLRVLDADLHGSWRTDVLAARILSLGPACADVLADLASAVQHPASTATYEQHKRRADFFAHLLVQYVASDAASRAPFSAHPYLSVIVLGELNLYLSDRIEPQPVLPDDKGIVVPTLEACALVANRPEFRRLVCWMLSTLSQVSIDLDDGAGAELAQSALLAVPGSDL